MVAWGAVLGVAALTFVVSLAAGGIPLWRRLSSSPELLARMTAVAAGFLLASAMIVAVPEGFELLNHGDEHEEHDDDDHDDHANETVAEHEEHADEDEEEHHEVLGLTPTVAGGVAVLAGFMLVFLLEIFGVSHDIHEEAHEDDHDHTHDDEVHEGSADHAHEHSRGHADHPHHPAAGVVGSGDGRHLAWVVVVGLTLHAAMDGVALGASLAGGSVALTISLVIAVSMHKVPAAFSMTTFSRHEGVPERRMIIDLIAFSLATPVALIVVASLLHDIGDQWIGLALLVSGGTFLYIATVDVLPRAHAHSNGKRLWAWVLLGALVVSALLIGLDLLGVADPHGH